jgi:hypothetical protein
MEESDITQGITQEERLGNILAQCDEAVESGLIKRYEHNEKLKSIRFTLRNSQQYAWLDYKTAKWYIQGLSDAFKLCGKKFAPKLTFNTAVFRKTDTTSAPKTRKKKESIPAYGGLIGELMAKASSDITDLDVSDLDDLI